MIALNVVYENEHVLFVNKESGMLSQKADNINSINGRAFLI